MRSALHGTLFAFGLVFLPVSLVAQEEALPEGVTEEMIREGQRIFRGTGICAACHGQQARGIPNLGADLTDDEWLHSDGGYEGIARTIREGVTADQSSTGTAMPPKGGSSINDDGIAKVTAYVWSLRRGS
jgi:mono/diheme cytochrome c family protein